MQPCGQPLPWHWKEPMGRASWAVELIGLSPQSLLAMSPEKRKLAAQEGRPAEPLPEEQPKDKPHTLEEFSYEFFRCHSGPHQALPAPLCSLRVTGRPWRQVLCPPGLPGERGPSDPPTATLGGQGE